MTAADRAARTAAADALCAQAYADAQAPEIGACLVAVGGFGRGELAPSSDLDVVLLHDDLPLGDWAARIWYPLWDSGADVDHSVRGLAEMLDQAAADPRVMMGLLDLRHLAGDPHLAVRARTAILTEWRRDARSRLPELRALGDRRATRLGELAHAGVPDLKDSMGGLRDATVLKALVASWLVDVPHAEVEGCRQALLDVRDALQEVAGRATDRVLPEYWLDLADRLGLGDAVSAQRHVRGLGRRLTHIVRLTWRRVDAVQRTPRASGARRPDLETIARGVAISRGEVVLDGSVSPQADPLLLLRAAAEAAERDLVLSPATAARLVRQGAPLPEPWPSEARDLLVRLLASGRGLLATWETLEETGALDRLLPEWRRVSLLPHASVVHRYTVDRHLIETCIEASALIRQVARPDVLVVAALLHDIGKGQLTEHCVAGAPLARTIARRMGFDDDAVSAIEHLVRWHLLLAETATTRDPDDPATLAAVASRVTDPQQLDLLATLTEADARATSDQAWTSWRAGLVRGLTAGVAATLAHPSDPRPEQSRARLDRRDRARLLSGEAIVRVDDAEDGSWVEVVAWDRVGLLADVAAALALARLSVRSARMWTQEPGEVGLDTRHAGRVAIAVSRWWIREDRPDPAVLRQRLERVVAGELDPSTQLRRRLPSSLAPSVLVRPGASRTATVLEVRAEDRPGLIHIVCTALAGIGASVRSAHVDTVGPQAVDVFYVQEEAAGPLAEERAARAAHAIRSAIEATVQAPV